MAKIIDLISDVELRLSKGNVSDDFQISRRLIRAWMDFYRAALIEERFKEEGMQGLESFISPYECIDIESDEKECSDGCESVTYKVVLPVAVANLPRGLGIYRVETQSGKTIHRMRLTDKERFKNLKFGSPSRDNIAYWWVKDELLLAGGTDNFLKNGKVNLYIIIEDTSSLDDEDEYPADGSVIPQILDYATKKGMQTLGMPEDEINDGKQA